jgi:hypothetical protein
MLVLVTGRFSDLFFWNNIFLGSSFVGGSFSRWFYTIIAVLMAMGAQVNFQIVNYIIHDTRGLPENDVVYYMATKIADEIMEGIDSLFRSNTIEVATLFITQSGAQLIILARSFDKRLIAPAFRSTLKSVTFESESGYLQKYVIPILVNENDLST